jgi:hypothetical protein
MFDRLFDFPEHKRVTNQIDYGDIVLKREDPYGLWSIFQLGERLPLGQFTTIEEATKVVMPLLEKNAKATTKEVAKSK